MNIEIIEMQIVKPILTFQIFWFNISDIVNWIKIPQEYILRTFITLFWANNKLKLLKANLKVFYYKLFENL